MDLFSYNWQEKVNTEGPLASRMRPQNLDDFVGQQDILAEGAPLRKAILSDRLASCLFYGPPGTGKTTLARLISNRTSARFVQLNAVSTGVAEVRKLIEEARMKWGAEEERTMLFLDEIHRFNKSQQDALLAAIEEGTLLFIGATTENPFFHLTSPLLSRVRIFVFRALSEEDIIKLLRRALADDQRGLGGMAVQADDDALETLARKANGDARSALNVLEMAVLSLDPDDSGMRHLTREAVEEAFATRVISYDRAGDAHYDMASAFIKSIRGSDPDAALYWMARMLRGGEDPMFIARRLVISASEDIGNADPRGLQVAVAAFQALQLVGMPEGRINLAQAVTYLATAPKSNASYLAVDEALAEVDRQRHEEVPRHLRGTGYSGAKRLGHGEGYLYPHDYPGGEVEQEYLPPQLSNKTFYRPQQTGYEARLQEKLNKLRARRAGRRKAEQHPKEGREPKNAGKQHGPAINKKEDELK